MVFIDCRTLGFFLNMTMSETSRARGSLNDAVEDSIMIDGSQQNRWRALEGSSTFWHVRRVTTVKELR